MLTNTIVIPYIIHCSEIWGNACHAYVDPLIKTTIYSSLLETEKFTITILGRGGEL